MRNWDWVWWVIGVIIAAVEGTALVRRRTRVPWRPFSDVVWDWVRAGGRLRTWRVFIIVIAGIWLTGHLAFKVW